MKKILLISTAVAISFNLVSCNTMNDTARFATSTVGTGIKYTASTVGTGLGIVGNVGSAVGRGVGTVVNTGVGVVGGPTYTKTHTVYRHGHHYMLENGRYVRVN